VKDQDVDEAHGKSEGVYSKGVLITAESAMTELFIEFGDSSVLTYRIIFGLRDLNIMSDYITLQSSSGCSAATHGNPYNT